MIEGLPSAEFAVKALLSRLAHHNAAKVRCPRLYKLAMQQRRDDEREDGDAAREQQTSEEVK